MVKLNLVSCFLACQHSDLLTLILQLRNIAKGTTTTTPIIWATSRAHNSSSPLVDTSSEHHDRLHDGLGEEEGEEEEGPSYHVGTGGGWVCRSSLQWSNGEFVPVLTMILTIISPSLTSLALLSLFLATGRSSSNLLADYTLFNPRVSITASSFMMISRRMKWFGELKRGPG